MKWEIGPDLRKMQILADLSRAAARAKPSSIESWLMLGRALMRLSKFDEAAATLSAAIAVLPPSAELELELAQALLLQDRFEEALPHTENALAIAPGDRSAKRLHLDVLAALKRWDKVEAAMEAVANSSPEVPRLMEMQARLHGPSEALKLFDSRLAADPAHTDAKFLKAIALAELGLDEQARSLISIDKLVEIQNLTPPAGYAGDQSFRDALAREIRTNPTLTPDHRGKATNDTLATRSLRQPDAPAIEGLLTQFRRAVDAYELALIASGDDFARGRPRKAHLESWAIVYGRAGRQKAHRHPNGWLSGVYYVSAPRLNGEKNWRGPLILGALDPEAHRFDPPWGTREIEPVPGRLILFPSYVPHATEPSGVDGERICVAFDVVPARESATS